LGASGVEIFGTEDCAITGAWLARWHTENENPQAVASLGI